MHVKRSEGIGWRTRGPWHSPAPAFTWVCRGMTGSRPHFSRRPSALSSPHSSWTRRLELRGTANHRLTEARNHPTPASSDARSNSSGHWPLPNRPAQSHPAQAFATALSYPWNPQSSFPQNCAPSLLSYRATHVKRDDLITRLWGRQCHIVFPSLQRHSPLCPASLPHAEAVEVPPP